MAFAERVRTGWFGRGKQVQANTVASTLTAIGQKIAQDTNVNPTKLTGSDKFLPALQEMLDSYRNADPPAEKKLPIEADVPELLFEIGYGPNGTVLGKTVGDLTLIAFYYLLRVGEYTVKGSRNESKRTVQFKLEDITFFCLERTGTTPLPPTERTFCFHPTGRGGNTQTGQSEKWLERGLHLPATQWGPSKVPHAGTSTASHTSPHT